MKCITEERPVSFANANICLRAIAAIFRECLKSFVESSDLTFPLQFLPGIATMSAEESFTPHALRDKPNMQQGSMTFKITSPLFYAQISRCPSVSEYVEVALSKPDPGTATFHTSHPDLLAKIFKEPPSAIELFKMWPWWNVSLLEGHSFLWMLWDKSPLPPTSLLERLRWVSIHLLRRLPSPSHNSALSDLDSCAVHLPATDAPKARAYRKAVLKILLSEYVAFGMPAVIDVALWILRIWLCWLCVLSFDGLVALCNGDARFSVVEVAKVVMGCLGVHLWWGVGEML